MNYFLRGKRKQQHLQYLRSFLRDLDNKCNQLRLNMNDSNQKESVKQMRIYTALQKKYRRRFKLLEF